MKMSSIFKSINKNAEKVKNKQISDILPNF